MKQLICEYKPSCEYHDGGVKKHFPVLEIMFWCVQITTEDEVDSRIIYPIPDAPGFVLAGDAQTWAEEWLDIPANRKSMYNKVD